MPTPAPSTQSPRSQVALATRMRIGQSAATVATVRLSERRGLRWLTATLPNASLSLRIAIMPAMPYVATLMSLDVKWVWEEAGAETHCEVDFLPSTVSRTIRYSSIE